MFVISTECKRYSAVFDKLEVVLSYKLHVYKIIKRVCFNARIRQYNALFSKLTAINTQSGQGKALFHPIIVVRSYFPEWPNNS